MRSDGNWTVGQGGAGWWHRAGEGGRTDVGRASVAGCGRVGTCRVHHVGAGRPHRPLGASERDTPIAPGSGGLLCAPDAEGVNRSGDMCSGPVCGCGGQMSRGWAAYLKARGGNLQRSQRSPGAGMAIVRGENATRGLSDLLSDLPSRADIINDSVGYVAKRYCSSFSDLQVLYNTCTARSYDHVDPGLAE